MEPLSQAMKDDQEIIKMSLWKSTLSASNEKPEPRGVANPVDFTEDTITEQMETPAELRLDGNSENTESTSSTSFGTHATTSDKREQLASQAEEVLSRIEELKTQVTVSTTTDSCAVPLHARDCEDKAGELL